MKCKKCRKQIPDGSKFCNHCGTPLTDKKKLYRRSDGLYEKILIIDGKRVAFRAKKEADVYKKIREYEVRREAGPTFAEVADTWHTEHWCTLSPTTQKSDKAAYEEIKKYFDSDLIREITHKDINAYMKQLPKTFARKTCTKRLNIINMIFKFAVVEDIVTDNPCTYISVPKGHGSKKRRAPTSDEIEIIKKSTGVEYKSFPVGLYAVFLLFTGLRKGEALALTYGDIDFDEKTISINKSVFFVENHGRLKKPKTEAGIRTITLSDYLAQVMPRGKKSDYIFSSTPTEPMTEGFHQYAMVSWREQTGLNLTAHQLRHGCGTLLHEGDVKPKDAQEWLGHADISTTLNIYTEVSKKRKATVAEQINKVFQ